MYISKYSSYLKLDITYSSQKQQLDHLMIKSATLHSLSEQKETHTHPLPSIADKYDMTNKNLFKNPYVVPKR